MDRSTHSLRWHSPAVFALIGLCFLLPFGTASCNGTETTFTGAQLATWNVPDDGSVDSIKLRMHIEDGGSALAAVALATAALGLVIGVLRLPWGEGYCAGLALVLMVVLLGKAVNSLAITIHAGYGLALLLMLWAAGVHARRAWRAGRAGPAPTPRATSGPPPGLR
jgi:hypothetical protein